MRANMHSEPRSNDQHWMSRHASGRTEEKCVWEGECLGVTGEDAHLWDIQAGRGLGWFLWVKLT